MRLFALLFLVVLQVMSFASSAAAYGKGPIGIWLASERYALLADSSLPGLVLVDLETGRVVERMIMQDGRPIDVASCPECDFLFVTSRAGESLLRQVKLPGTVSNLLERDGKLGLDRLEFEDLDPELSGPLPSDVLIGRLTADGAIGYVSSRKDRAVYKVEFGPSPTISVFRKFKKSRPYGIDIVEDGDLLISMHKREVWRINAQADTIDTIGTADAGCQGTRKNNPLIRAAIEDPEVENAYLVLATNPHSYDGVIWRISKGFFGRWKCDVVAGGIGNDPGWLDAEGDEVIFTRPHRFALTSIGKDYELVLTDVDNRALRIVDVSTGSSSTIMYDRDRRIAEISSDSEIRPTACENFDSKDLSLVDGISGQTTCILESGSASGQISLESAEEYCQNQGARLCEPAELRSLVLAPGARAWTNARCSSCWQRHADSTCDAKIETHKTADLVHKQPGFSQGWNSGQAMEVADASTGKHATFCVAPNDNVSALAICCADSKGSD